MPINKPPVHAPMYEIGAFGEPRLSVCRRSKVKLTWFSAARKVWNQDPLRRCQHCLEAMRAGERAVNGFKRPEPRVGE